MSWDKFCAFLERNFVYIIILVLAGMLQLGD